MRSVAVVVLSICVVLAAGCSRPAGDGASPQAARAAAAPRFHCPMHPSIVQDHPGDCPVCNMKLVPVVDAAAKGAGDAHGGALAVPAAISVSVEKQKIIGVRVSPVQTTKGTHALRVLGRVAPDETLLYRLNAGINGSIREVSAVTTGSRVKKNEILGAFYAPEAISVLQLFILNTQGYDRIKGGGAVKPDGMPAGEGRGEDEAELNRSNRQQGSLYKANIQQRVMQLENYGVSEMQREEIAKSGRMPDAIKIVSPTDGFVLARNVSPGMKFDRGYEFYRIADLRKVWVLADVFPQDAQHVRAGMRATVSVPERKETLPAVITEILPQVDAAARTVKVKLTVNNPGYVLRPDMFVDVALSVALPDAVAVPADAIIDSGLAKTVFVQSADGVFEARKVETGWRSGDQVQIVSGLSPGEKIVTSGTFFLDSETRMRPPTREAAAGGGAAVEPAVEKKPAHAQGDAH